MLEFVFDRMNYWLIIILMMIGLHIVFGSSNLIKKLAGLSIFQTSVFLFYISIGKVIPPTGSEFTGPPILREDYAGHALPPGEILHSNPLPHVLILTAIVVGVATLSVGLALCVRIREAYGSIEEEAIQKIEAQERIPQPARREEKLLDNPREQEDGLMTSEQMESENSKKR